MMQSEGIQIETSYEKIVGNWLILRRIDLENFQVKTLKLEGIGLENWIRLLCKLFYFPASNFN